MQSVLSALTSGPRSCPLTLDCHDSCLSCSGPHLGSCTSCRDGQRLDAGGRCVPSTDACTPYQYEDEQGECLPCHKYCLRCAGPSKSDCLSCTQRHLLLSESGTSSRVKSTDTSVTCLFRPRVNLVCLAGYRWHLRGGMSPWSPPRRLGAEVRAVPPLLQLVRRGQEP